MFGPVVTAPLDALRSPFFVGAVDGAVSKPGGSVVVPALALVDPGVRRWRDAALRAPRELGRLWLDGFAGQPKKRTQKTPPKTQRFTPESSQQPGGE